VRCIALVQRTFLNKFDSLCAERTVKPHWSSGWNISSLALVSTAVPPVACEPRGLKIDLLLGLFVVLQAAIPVCFVNRRLLEVVTALKQVPSSFLYGSSFSGSDRLSRPAFRFSPTPSCRWWWWGHSVVSYTMRVRCFVVEPFIPHRSDPSRHWLLLKTCTLPGSIDFCRLVVFVYSIVPSWRHWSVLLLLCLMQCFGYFGKLVACLALSGRHNDCVAKYPAWMGVMSFSVSVTARDSNL